MSPPDDGGAAAGLTPAGVARPTGGRAARRPGRTAGRTFQGAGVADPPALAAPGTAAGLTTRAALRLATGEIHERLHDLPALRALAAGGISREGYIALLRRLQGFHAAAEAALAAAPSLAPFGIALAERRRAGLLARDLAELGALAGQEAITQELIPSGSVASGPVVSGAAASGAVALAPLPPLGSAAAALGCLYVTEGSTLGGRQLARGLDHLLPPGEAGRGFLLGHGARHGAMWQECCAALEQCGADPARRATMLAAAEATFAAFEAWFARPG